MKVLFGTNFGSTKEVKTNEEDNFDYWGKQWNRERNCKVFSK
jgi:hypothetical protein